MLGPWSVVRTRVQAEKRATIHLHNQGFEVYAPRYRRTRVVRGKRVQTVHNLFPRYLFVRTEGRWGALAGTRGVQEVLLVDGAPARLEESVIDELRARHDIDGFVKFEKYRRGQSVLVRSGSLAGHIVLCEGMCDGDRVAILFQFLGRTVRTVVNSEELAAA